MASTSTTLAKVVTHFEGNKRKYIIWVAAGLGVASIAGCIWYYVQESYYYYTPVEVGRWVACLKLADHLPMNPVSIPAWHDLQLDVQAV